MTARHANELLYDSEAALRLVDSAIEDLRTLPHPNGVAGASAANGSARHLLPPPGPLDLVGISQILARSYGEIVKVLGRLRESRNVLEQTSVEKLHHTHDKLREVTTATQMAASDILDGLDRAVGLVNDMDLKANDGDTAGGRELRDKLRDELFSLMGRMQFQDITTQQLTYASSVLTELETRLAQLATILDPTALKGAGAVAVPPGPSGAPTFDPEASMHSADARQAVADQIFDRSRA